MSSASPNIDIPGAASSVSRNLGGTVVKPESLESILPAYNPRAVKDKLSAPLIDRIIVGLAVGPPTKSNSPTDIGLSWMDPRELMRRWPEPGDRGSFFRKWIHSSHYIAEEFWFQGLGKPLDSSLVSSDGQNDPRLFAFKKSNIKKEAEVAIYSNRTFKSLLTMHLEQDEKENGTLRNILIISLDPDSVKEAMASLGLDWLSLPNVQLLDLRQASLIKARFAGETVPIDSIMEVLGLRYIDGAKGSLLACAGNVAAFLNQILLALVYLSHEQRDFFDRWQPIPFLSFSWVAHALDQQNIHSGEQKNQRPAEQQNNHDVPQKRVCRFYKSYWEA